MKAGKPYESTSKGTSFYKRTYGEPIQLPVIRRVPIRYPSIQTGALPILLIFNLKKTQILFRFTSIMAYETEKVDCGLDRDPATLDQVLNKRLSNGWRVVAITPINRGGIDYGANTAYLLVTFEN